jgi:5'-nucleotidase
MKRVYVDMDGVLVDFQSGIDQLSEETKLKYKDRLDDVPGIFGLMKPRKDAIESYKWLNDNFDTYILSTAPWNNETAWIDKLRWVKKYLGDVAEKRLILSHHKNLCQGDFIIDDRKKRGVDKFTGEHIHMKVNDGGDYENWEQVINYMKKQI